MHKDPGLPLKKPVSWWNKAIKVNYKEFFKSLARGIISTVTAEWDKAAQSAVDAVSAFGLKENSGEVAYLLIYRSLIAAVYALVKEHLQDLSGHKPDNLDDFCETLDLSLEKKELQIDEDFFSRPQEFPLLADLQIPFRQMLKGFSLTHKQAEELSKRLPSYFVFALNNEWGEHSQDYAGLKERLRTPFTKASDRESLWLRYQAWLQKRVNERLFAETFSLRRIYIPLRAFYQEKAKKGEVISRPYIIGEKQLQVVGVVDLQTHLDDWLNKADRQDAVRVISGGPGSGKSSFLRMFAAHRAEKEVPRVIFIPLHLFKPDVDLVDAVHNFAQDNQLLPAHPLDSKTSEIRLLLIFEGLDEIGLQGRAGAEIARDFIREIQKKVEIFNSQKTRLQVLLSGRELLVQGLQSEFRRPHQTLHLLPYFVSESEKKKYDFKDPDQLLKKDQRQEWWQLYGQAIGQEFQGLPNALQREKLEDITAQPLLNYLVAQSFIRQKVDFSKGSTINVIYNDLIEAVRERGWEGYRPHPGLEPINEQEFIRVLEEIALAAWHHGDALGRQGVTVREMETHFVQSDIRHLMQHFEEGAKQGITNLLIAFYFRQSGLLAGERTFEFTHKSFAEYLLSRKLVGSLGLIQEELKRYIVCHHGGWSEKEALTFWAKLTGPVALNLYIFSYLLDELHLRGKEKVTKWQESLGHLISYMLIHGLPMESLTEIPTFQEKFRQAQNTEEALLAALNACARFTQVLSHVDWPSDRALRAWVGRIRGQRTERILFLECLSFLNIAGQNLEAKDLRQSNFSCSNLSGANLSYSNLSMADLSGANLSEANLFWANFSDANLFRANLIGANLSEANFFGANLSEAKLTHTQILEGKFEGSNVQGAYVSEY